MQKYRLLKYIFLFSILLNILVSEELPQTFKQLSTPLYESYTPIKKLSGIESLKNMLSTYATELDNLKKLGFEVDKTKNKKEVHQYLLELRAFEKKYDFILHEIHMSINKAINNDNYKLFIKLTKYEFDGLLKNRTLLEKSLKFYQSNSKKNTIAFFEKKMKYKKIEIRTSQEFYNLASKSEYNSKNKNKSKNKKVNIEVVNIGKSMIVYIENNNPYTITIKLEAKYQGLNYDRSIRKEFPIKANTKKEYIRLHRQRGVLSSSYSYRYSWIIGSVDAVHDDSYIYRLPFAKGKSYKVSQGYNGRVTHKGSSQYAIDFSMKIGTKIYAAREGIVVKTKQNSNKGGFDKKFASSGNYITIEHSDTTFATYYHLRKNGVRVKIGDKVSKGTFIGYSGNTGYSSGPHLHFAIFKASNARRTQSIPITLRAKEGLINTPQQGKFYTAK